MSATTRGISAGAVRAGMPRRLDLDRAKGLGILLVVIGHLGARSVPPGNAWYAYLLTVLYQFHMPFFMYLSGYVSLLSGAVDVRPDGWSALVLRRAERLLLPFLVFGLLIIAGKLWAAHFMVVDNMPASWWEGLRALAWDTDRSPAFSVWYIAVLFVISIVVPPLMWLARGRVEVLLVFAAAVYVLPLPHVMFMDRVGHFLLFFVVGAVAARYQDPWLALVDRFWLPFAAALVALLALVVVDFDALPEFLRLLVCGLLSMPALHGLVRSPPCADSRVLQSLGIYSFVIYLLNTPLIGLAKGLMLKVAPWDGSNFLVFAPVMTLAGILGPIWIKRHIIRRWPALDRLTS